VTDLTLIVTAHNETVVSGPTVESADLAVAAARDAGYTVQTMRPRRPTSTSTRATSTTGSGGSAGRVTWGACATR
jgi:hypothetical protein